MAQALMAHFQVLTPLFMAGADQTRPEIRAASLRGLLRFWLRAVDPRYRDSEPALFGGTGQNQGQGAVLLRVEADTPKKRNLTFASFNPGQFNQGRGPQTRNGLRYIGYPFDMGDNKDRQAIPAGHTFTLRCLLPRAGDGGSEHVTRMRRALVAALWLLGHFGGGGSRSRRGFGAFALTGWEAADPLAGSTAPPPWPECAALPLAVAANDAATARRSLERGLETLRDWFPSADESEEERPHPHLGPAFRYHLLDQPVARDGTAWAAGLNAMGRRMQDFRAAMAKEDSWPARVERDGVTPARATFGLPLTFRAGRTVTLVPLDPTGHTALERQGSLLLLHLLAVGDRLYPLYVRLDGAVPGVSPPAAGRGQRRPLRPPPDNAMDAFLDTLDRAGRP